MKKLSKFYTLIGSLLLVFAFSSSASAEVNPFSDKAEQVQSIAGDDGKCGDDKKKKDGKCGEGKCGDKKAKKGKKDGKCGEGKCGDKKGKKDKKESKCGEK